MIKFTGDNITCRVWVTADQDFNVDTVKLRSVMSDFKSVESTISNMNIIVNEIEKLDNIAAIEVLDKDGNGILLYPDWN